VTYQGRSRIIESDRLDFGPTEVDADPHHFASSLKKTRPLSNPSLNQPETEPDSDLRDTESVPLSNNIDRPLPIHYKRADSKEQDGHLLRLTGKRRIVEVADPDRAKAPSCDGDARRAVS
jgi:hypothetical protein